MTLYHPLDIVNTTTLKVTEMGLSEFYDSIDLDKINEFIESQSEEDLHLDFKRLNDPEMDREDKKNFAKALSGFANADGGIIVWGIDARRNSEGINCASDKIPIKPLQLTISRLNELTGSLVNPSVDGVIHKPIEIEDNAGFVVTLIPSSDSTPHMAKGRVNRYFKRSGDSFITMEHFDLEDMFGRRPKPKLRLICRIIKGPGRRGSALDFNIIVGMENYGRGLARAPYLSIKTHVPCRISEYGIDGNGREGLNRLATPTDSQWVSYGGTGDIVIHPGTKLDILALRGTFDPNVSGFTDLAIDYQITSEGMKLIGDTLRIDVNDLIRDIRRAWR